MEVERLIKGHPYTYSCMGGNTDYQVLYTGPVRIADGSIVYNFRFRREVKVGFVNLPKDKVTTQIH